jgi:Zn finger protein HypA/HybF involved in hydrogenase expression
MKKFPQQLLNDSGCSSPEEFFEEKSIEMMDSIQPVYCTDCGHEVTQAEPDAQMSCPECGGKAYGLETFALVFLS